MALLIILQYSIIKFDLEISHHEAIARAVYKKLTSRINQKGAVITVQDVYTKVTKKMITEVRKARRTSDLVEAVELSRKTPR